MTLVIRRQEWLTAVLEGTDQTLVSLSSRLAAESEDNSSDGKSRDMGSVARAGPCAGYEELEPFTVLEEHAPAFRLCASEADIKATGE